MPLTKILEAEHDRLILFVPVLLAMGAVGYFSLLVEPPQWVGLALLAGFSMSAYACKRWVLPCSLFAILAIIAGGVALAQWRTHSITPSVLAAPINFAHVSGILENIEQTPKGSKIIVKNVAVEGLASEQTPKRISLTLRRYDPSLIAGQKISVRAGLFPPPEPALPGGFDFSRYYYFNGIGAVGYGIPPLEALPLEESGASNLSIAYSRARHTLTQSIRSFFHEPAGSIAAAFITGQTQTIPSSINDDMRTAGLYHLLAVSGMNLSVVAGIAFFSVRLMLAAIPAISLRYPIKKWAAALALLMSYLYLEIAGSPVSAQRAFLMVSFIFIAILLDRDPAPMRSVALSALLILCVRPEAALTASFQLSYSATAALIASYEWGAARINAGHSGIGLPRVFFYFAAVMATSLVAWLGTEPFIIYNFNQFSSYSLLANTIAEPLVSFILMPLVIAGVLLMPLGLAWLAFAPMQYGVDLLISIAHYVATLPHALWIVPAPTDAGFCATVAGLIWLYFWKTRWRWLGVPVAVVGMCTAFAYTPPDILISGDGKHIALRLEQGGAAMIKGRKDSFIASQWSHAFTEHEMLDKKNVPITCDATGCILQAFGHKLALPKSPEALADDCAMADVIIATDFSVPRENCRARLVIDQNALQTGGSVSVTFKGTLIEAAYARAHQGSRPWVRQTGSYE